MWQLAKKVKALHLNLMYKWMDNKYMFFLYLSFTSVYHYCTGTVGFFYLGKSWLELFASKHPPNLMTMLPLASHSPLLTVLSQMCVCVYAVAMSLFSVLLSFLCCFYYRCSCYNGFFVVHRLPLTHDICFPFTTKCVCAVCVCARE